MPNIIGQFYFDLTAAGNLVGEYWNDQAQGRVLPETALRDDASLGIEGDYISTWYEPHAKDSVTAKLTIRQSGNSYTLEWYERKGTAKIFEGAALLIGSRLQGRYHSI